jgi:hypothetical protein
MRSMNKLVKKEIQLINVLVGLGCVSCLSIFFMFIVSLYLISLWF